MMTAPVSYLLPRHDVAALVPSSARRILELGCSNGATGGLIMERQTCDYFGIELDAGLAEQASSVLTQVLVRDLGTDGWSLDIGTGVDCVIAADVLEHLVDPWKALAEAVKLLAPGGSVVLSVPNARHCQTILNLVTGRWPYRDRGIHDATHLRFFTMREVRGLLGINGLCIDRLVRNRRVLDTPSAWDRLLPAASMLGLGDLVTYQFILRARPCSQPERIASESVPPRYRPDHQQGGR